MFKHSGNISSIAKTKQTKNLTKSVGVSYNSECCWGTATPHLLVDTQILSSTHGQSSDKGLAN